jgi:hypothetical protein
MADRRRRPPKPLRRNTAIRPPRKTLLIFCEGARTEPEYLEALRREPVVREIAAVDIRIAADSAGFTPLGLVRRAIAARAKALAEDGEIDEFWCVFDIEWPKNHPGLIEAKKLADAHGISIAASNPCFEVWLVLHFAGHEGWLDNDGARRLRRKHDNRTERDSIRLATCPIDRLRPIAPSASISVMFGTAPRSRMTTRLPACTG